MKHGGLETLEVWVEARALAVRIYREVVPGLPSEEKWGLSDQLRRASTSVVANIAEGYGRYYLQERVRFCYVARGSLQEISALLVLATDLGYLDKGNSQAINATIQRLMRRLNKYIQFLKRQVVDSRRRDGPQVPIRGGVHE